MNLKLNYVISDSHRLRKKMKLKHQDKTHPCNKQDDVRAKSY